MSPENKPLTEKDLQSTVTRLKRIIIFLTLVLIGIGAIYVFNHLYDNSIPFNGQVKDSTANLKMNNYRRGIHLNSRSMGVYYSVDSIKKYVNDYFPQLIKEQEEYQSTRRGQNGPDSFPYHDYQWVVGFYWMKKKDPSTEGNANKLDFYVIPTLVHKTKKLGVIDYYTDKDSIYYHGKSTQIGKSTVKTGQFEVAYDEGQLWP